MYIKLVITHDWHIAIRQLPKLQGSWNFPNIVTIRFVQRLQELAVGKGTETWAPVCCALLQMAKSDNKRRVITKFCEMNEVGFLKINAVCLHIHDKLVSLCSWSKPAIVCLTSPVKLSLEDVVQFISQRVASGSPILEVAKVKRILIQNVCDLLHLQTLLSKFPSLS